MAVSIHKHYVSSDADDLERAAGAMLIASKVPEDDENRLLCIGASAALYAIAQNDLRTEEDFKKCWSLLVKEMK